MYTIPTPQQYSLGMPYIINAVNLSLIYIFLLFYLLWSYSSICHVSSGCVWSWLSSPCCLLWLLVRFCLFVVSPNITHSIYFGHITIDHLIIQICCLSSVFFSFIIIYQHYMLGNWNASKYNFDLFAWYNGFKI